MWKLVPREQKLAHPPRIAKPIVLVRLPSFPLQRAIHLLPHVAVFYKLPCSFPRPGFEALNESRREAGEPEFANPRNTAAGTLKLQDSAVVELRV